MEIKETPNYYAILPANVRYDKRLKLLSRLMYAEITSLCNKEGYCWATNSYFANLYEVSTRTITDCISQLKEYSYIKIVYIDKNANTDKRKIYINDIQNIDSLEENFKGSRRKLRDGLEENFQQNNKKNNKKNNKDDNLETIDIIQDDKLTNNSLTSLSLNKDYKITNSNNIKAKDNIKNLNYPPQDCEFDVATNSYKQVDIQKENNINLIKNAIATSSINVLDSKTFKSIDDINMFDSYFNENAKEYGKQYPYYLNRMLEVHTYDYKTTFNILGHFIKYDFLDMSFLSFCNAIVVLANDLINTNIKSIFELCKGKDKVQVIENLFNQFVSNKIDIVNFIYEYKDFIENNFSEWYSTQPIHTKKASIVKQLINQMECFINE